jgi:hypothetical protein
MRIQPAYEQLSPSERMFVDQVVQHLDRAATRMNERITMSLTRDLPQEIVDRSHGMLERALVQAAIETRVRQIATETEFTPERTLRELGQIAFSNIDDFMYDGMFDASRATRSQWSAVRKVKFKGGSLDSTLMGAPDKAPEIEIEFYNKLDALKMFMVYQGMLTEDNPHWRRETDRVALPVGATAADAAVAYQALLDG